ncbi:MAG: helix-turn-helix domain-containing protein [Bacilli bacterium]
MSNARSSFGEYLSSLRIRYGFSTQKQLADATGISQATLSRIEAGTQKPNSDTLKLLAQQLRPVTYGELMEKAGYLDNMSNPESSTASAQEEVR